MVQKSVIYKVFEEIYQKCSRNSIPSNNLSWGVRIPKKVRDALDKFARRRCTYGSQSPIEWCSMINNHGEEIMEKSGDENSVSLPHSEIEKLRDAEGYSLSSDSREAWALNLIEDEEVAMAKSLEKVDIVTKIGPTLGLMGTLIPMGPGLAALGSGDVTTLATAIIVAIDTTVVGIGSGAVAYVISKIRRRWYEEYSSNLQLFVNAVLENLNK